MSLCIADQVIQFSHYFLTSLLTPHVVFDDLIREDELEPFLDGSELLDICNETVRSFSSGVPIDSEDLGEETGLFLFLTDCPVVVVDLVLVDTDDAFLLHPHVVHLHHCELFVKRGLAQADGQGYGRRWKWLLLLVECETAYHLRPISTLKLTLIDISFGFDLDEGKIT